MNAATLVTWRTSRQCHAELKALKFSWTFSCIEETMEH